VGEEDATTTLDLEGAEDEDLVSPPPTSASSAPNL
jgi:hypothetical protein